MADGFKPVSVSKKLKVKSTEGHSTPKAKEPRTNAAEASPAPIFAPPEANPGNITEEAAMPPAPAVPLPEESSHMEDDTPGAAPRGANPDYVPTISMAATAPDDWLKILQPTFHAMADNIGKHIAKKVDKVAEELQGEIKEIKITQKRFEERIDTRMKSLSSTNSSGTSTTLPDESAGPPIMSIISAPRDYASPTSNQGNAEEHQGYSLRNGSLRIVIGGPTWVIEKKRDTLTSAGQRLHSLLPHLTQFLVEGTPIVVGKRAKFISYRVKRLSVNDMWECVKAWKNVTNSLPATHEFHGFWIQPDRPLKSRLIARTLAAMHKAIKLKWPAVAESIEACYTKKRIFAGDELIFSMTTSATNNAHICHPEACVAAGFTSAELETLYTQVLAAQNI